VNPNVKCNINRTSYTFVEEEEEEEEEEETRPSTAW